MKLTRKKWLLIFLGVVAAAVAVWYFAWPVSRTIHRTIPIGPDEAVLLTRGWAHGDHHHFVEVVGADGTARWQHDLSPAHFDSFVGGLGVAADPNHVYVLATHDRSCEVIALDHADGGERWRTMVAGDQLVCGIHDAIVVDGGRLVVIHEINGLPKREDSITATGLATADGAMLWPKPGQQRYAAETVAPDRVGLGPRGP